ncbi:hypothetical protein [Alkalihalobacterium alkalinitrilicum]|uniref:hypothetical protein n=1 Tax=Alkalihalobacterium alkalinitrilicum TaxID=427920 RepID=UPI001303C137|nr:hypothetical protein [Alkalihalobacterium alkalinitrilicum]
MKSTVYYDYHDGEKVPLWYVLNFGSGNLDWDTEYLYVPIVAPFEIHGVEDFDNDTLSASITFGDLTKRIDKPNTIGIYLPHVKRTISDFGGDYHDIDQFIFLVSDIEEILQLSVIRDHMNY